MKPGQALSPAIVESITQLLATGHTQKEIAVMLDVSRTSVQRYGANPEIRVKIEKAQADMAGETLDKIIEIDRAILDTTQDFIQGKSDQDGKRIGGATPKQIQEAPVLIGTYQKYAKGVKQSLGIAPSPGQNVFIENLYANKGPVIAPGVLALISGALAIPEDTSDQDIIDGEYSIIE